MKQYIIDGNNLIGKIKSLSALQKKNGQAAREQLVFMLDNYFSTKKADVSLCLDGFQNSAIRTNKLKLYYSDKRSADDVIKRQIELSKNTRLIVVVTSDHNIMQFARVCRCDVLSSEDFAREITSRKILSGEEEKKKSISDDEIKRLFGLK